MASGVIEKEDPLRARVAWPSQGEIVLDQFSCGAAQFPSYVQRPPVILLPKNAPARMLKIVTFYRRGRFPRTAAT